MTRRLLAPIIGIITFLALWEGFVRVMHVRRFILRAPSTALRHLWDFRSGYLSGAWITIQHSLLGLAFALAAAILVGAALASNHFLQKAVQPVLTLVQVTPWFAYVSSVVVWLGFGTAPALFMVTLVCLPAYVFATVDGMHSVEPAALELLASVDARRSEVLWRLRLPAALPGLFTTTRFNYGLSLAAAYYVEGANGASEGLGSIGRKAASSSSKQAPDAVWAAVFAVATLGVVGLLLLSWLERVLLHWHAGQRVQDR